jgi:hypothetical protein
MKPVKKKVAPNTSSVAERWKKKVAIKKTKILQAMAVSENSGYTAGTTKSPPSYLLFLPPPGRVHWWLLSIHPTRRASNSVATAPELLKIYINSFSFKIYILFYCRV